jgi:hypothetical protein
MNLWGNIKTSDVSLERGGDKDIREGKQEQLAKKILDHALTLSSKQKVVYSNIVQTGKY